MFATNSSINQQVTLFCQITQLVVFKPLSVKYQQSLGGVASIQPVFDRLTQEEMELLLKYVQRKH